MELQLTTNSSNRDMILALVGTDSLGVVIDNTVIKLYFPEKMKASVDSNLQNLQPQFNFNWNWEVIQDENWHLAWKENFQPVNITEKITIVPSWDTITQSDVTIRIEPGRAFGTGHHQTTNLAMQMLERLVTEGCSVLDLGAGSGILSIAAKLLGAGTIDAVEFDSDCTDNFQQNLIHNNLNGTINYHLMDVLKWKKFDYDVIVININRNTILELIPNLKNSNGKIILTGLLKTDEEFILTSCQENNLKMKNIQTRDEWIGMELKSE